VKLHLREDMHALSGAYALDAIDGPERERFEHHLSRCQACQNEVQGLQETATRFALAVATQPPSRLKATVLAAAARTRQHPPAAAPDPGLAPQPSVTWPRRLAIPLAAACLVLAIVLGVLLGMARSQLDTARAQQREIAAVLTAPGARIVSGRTSVGGSATVIVATSLHQLVFTSAGMPSLPESRIYQLWLLGPDGSTTSAGLLTQGANGTTAPVLAAGLVPGDRVGVTVEPAGGTAKPTTTPIVVISLSS
jgi:anti-sigma-K factor RskA